MNVFFYGLFMDASLLSNKGITPRSAEIGHVDDFELRIGERATLVRSPGARACGVLMDIAADELQRLYAENSVADYLPETVRVKLTDGSCVEASCYNLPGNKLVGTNRSYAKSLHELADRLGLDQSYVGEIKRFAEQGK